MSAREVDNRSLGLPASLRLRGQNGDDQRILPLISAILEFFEVECPVEVEWMKPIEAGVKNLQRGFAQPVPLGQSDSRLGKDCY